jgi:hypothetical protein
MTSVTLAMTVACLAGCSSGTAGPDASTIPRQTVMLTQAFPPGLIIEGSWAAGPSDRIELELSSQTAGFDFDIHAHNNGGTQDVTSGFDQTTVDYDFAPTADGPWYLLLRNSSGVTMSIDIQMTLYGNATWAGWQ